MLRDIYNIIDPLNLVKATTFGWIPLALMAGSAIVKGIQGKRAGDRQANNENAAREAQRQYEADRRAAQENLFAEMAGRGMDPYGPQVSTQSGTTYGTRSGTSSSQMRQVLQKGDQGNVDMIRRQLGQELDAPSMLPPGYAIRAASNVNNRMNQARSEAMNAIARRGGGAAEAGAGTIGLEQQRGGQIADMLNNLPMLERQLRRGYQQDALGIANALKGTNTNSQFSEQSQGGFDNTSTRPPDMEALFRMLSPSAPTPQDVQGPGWLDAGLDAGGAFGQMYMGGMGGGASQVATSGYNPGGYTPFRTGLNTNITAPTLK